MHFERSDIFIFLLVLALASFYILEEEQRRICAKSVDRILTQFSRSRFANGWIQTTDLWCRKPTEPQQMPAKWHVVLK